MEDKMINFNQIKLDNLTKKIMISVKIYKIFYKKFLNLRDNVLFVNNLDLLNDNFMRKFHGL